MPVCPDVAQSYRLVEGTGMGLDVEEQDPKRKAFSKFQQPQKIRNGMPKNSYVNSI